jgi:hypothetical protein
MRYALQLCLACVVFSAWAEPRNELEKALSTPRRFVQGAEVDLSPLIKWRVQRRSARPLQAWHYMSGRIVTIRPGQWLMEVEIEGEPEPQKILLRHPPQAALAEFNQLRHEYGVAKTHAESTDEAADLALESKADTRAGAAQINAPRRSRTLKGQILVREKRQAIREFQNAKAESVSAREEAQVARKRFRGFDSKGYNMQEDFRFLGYAMKLAERSVPDNLPIYDHGQIVGR